MRELSEIRVDIDSVDRQLALLFEQRMALADEVADYKKAKNMPVFVPEREKEVLAKKMTLFADKDAAFLEDVRVFYQTLMDLSKNEQLRRIERM